MGTGRRTGRKLYQKGRFRRTGPPPSSRSKAAEKSFPAKDVNELHTIPIRQSPSCPRACAEVLQDSLSRRRTGVGTAVLPKTPVSLYHKKSRPGSFQPSSNCSVFQNSRRQLTGPEGGPAAASSPQGKGFPLCGASVRQGRGSSGARRVPCSRAPARGRQVSLGRW